MPQRRSLMLLVLLSLLVVLWAVASWVIGRGVDAEIRRLDAELNALDTVSVETMTYRRGVFSGELEYAIRVDGGALLPEHAPLLVMSTGDRDGIVRLAGTAQVRHGPWLGDRLGVVAITAELRLPTPLMRGLLPDLPPDAAVLRVDALLDWSRQSRAQISGTDYQGRLGAGLMPIRGALDVHDWGGRLELHNDTVHAWFHTGRLDLVIDWPQPTAVSVDAFDLALRVAAPDYRIDIARRDGTISVNGALPLSGTPTR